MNSSTQQTNSKSPKAIFLGGATRSGKTLLSSLLNKHREIAAFGETKLTDNRIFLTFPEKIFESKPKLRPPLLNIFRQLCTTSLYCYLMFPKGSRKEKAWLYYEELWRSRLQCPQSFLRNNALWSLLEKLWIPWLLERTVCPSYHKKGSWSVGWRGLYKFFTKREIKRYFIHLTPLIDTATLDEAYRIYGTFWSYVFEGYAKRQKKKYWAEETPDNCLNIFFLKKCFGGLKFINLIRDGRDVAHFTNELWGLDMKHIINKWAQTLTVTINEQAKLTSQDYINIRYEDLVGNAPATLKKITDFLGVDFDKNMLSLPINQTGVGRYKNTLSSELKTYAKERYGSLLNQLGYPL